MALTVTDRLRVTHALRSRSFTLLLTGQTISTFGDVVYEIALTWQVLTLTHSAATLGIILTAVIVPKLLFLLVGGVVADRLPRRLVMLWSDSGRAIVMFLIVLLGWTHLLQFWHLVLLALFFGFVDGFFFPAYQAILPQFVDVDALTSANTLQSLSMRMSRICGAFLGLALLR